MNKVVLVTGASRGIGRATVLEFASHGYNVVINYISSEKEAKLRLLDSIEQDNACDAAELKEAVENMYGVEALTIEADISSYKEVCAMIEKVMNTFGRIDALVSNAGIVFDRKIEEVTEEEFLNTIEVDVMGGFFVAREVAKRMDKGSIVFVSSTNGTKVVADESIDYNIAKVGLQSLTRDLAYHYRPNIRVNAIAIGWADTDLNKDLDKEYVKEETNKIYLERFADPSEIAKTLYYLCSDDSCYINSEIITIDGGYY